MINFDANAVVHINESLSHEQIQNIEKNLSGVRGVVSACAHIKTPHLMVVDYDPPDYSFKGSALTLQAQWRACLTDRWYLTFCEVPTWV